MNHYLLKGSAFTVLWAAIHCTLGWTPVAYGQLAWDAEGQFQYNVLQSTVDSTGRVVVLFSVTNPLAGNAPWDIKNDPPFRLPGSRLFLQIGWDTRDYTNTGSLDPNLAPKPFGSGIAPAAPIAVNALTDSVPMGDGSYLVSTRNPLPPQAARTGVTAMEGHPVVQVNGVNLNVPVQSAFQYFRISGTSTTPRRESVDIANCMACHTGEAAEDGSVIPRLSLHGGNRTEELRVCVVCHNPNQTDIAYRTSGREESVDFKRMIHGIHAGKRRTNPLVIIGRSGSVNDFSDIRFPASLKNCVNCHIDSPLGGSFELPLQAGVLGSTVSTGSVPGVTVDINPANDRKITPIASVCSSCHDNTWAVRHMVTQGGASFSALPSQIASGAVRERCVQCHGPGRDKDVRRVHSIDNFGED